MKTRLVLSVLGLIALGLFVLAPSSLAFSGPGDPGAAITAVGVTVFYEGQTVTVQSTSSDPSGIVAVDLLVDGTVVRSDGPRSPVTTFTLTQTWTAVVGSHTLSVRSHTGSGQVSDSAGIPIMVVLLPVHLTAALATPTGTPVSGGGLLPFAGGPCTDNAQLIADVTIPPGTLLNPGQGFIKTWRVRNTGTCTWTNDYRLVFVGGEAMTTVTAFFVPVTPPGAMVDLPIQLTAPTVPGIYTGQWRLANSRALPFGDILTVIVQTASPSTACSGTPSIQYFNASPSTINPGDSSTLSWGLVGNANYAEIDQGIGGVSTPGSITVSPSTTTTYTLTGHCGANTATAQVTVYVVSATSTPTSTLTATATRTATPTRTLVPGSAPGGGAGTPAPGAVPPMLREIPSPAARATPTRTLAPGSAPGGPGPKPGPLVVPPMMREVASPTATRVPPTKASIAPKSAAPADPANPLPDPPTPTMTPTATAPVKRSFLDSRWEGWVLP
jgi:hypothetical protein